MKQNIISKLILVVVIIQAAYIGYLHTILIEIKNISQASVGFASQAAYAAQESSAYASQAADYALEASEYAENAAENASEAAAYIFMNY